MEEPGGQVRRALSGTRAIVRIAYRDPEHISERLTLHASRNLAAPAREWAAAARLAHPDATTAELAHDVRERSAKVARIDGAVAGTPFFIALVPGYVSYLWQEAHMGLRIAALYEHDPGTLQTAAEMLALRGVHPTSGTAEAALLAVRAQPPVIARRRCSDLGPLHPHGARLRRLPGRAHEGRAALGRTRWALGGGRADRLHDLGHHLGRADQFMIAMAWGCESHCAPAGLRTLALYDGEAATTKEAIAAARHRRDSGHAVRCGGRACDRRVVAIPMAFVAYANHVRQDTGINWIGALGALVALSLVIGAAVYGTRR